MKSETRRLSLRDGCTVSFVLSPARPGLFAAVFAKDAVASLRGDTSHWGVRTTRLRRPRHAHSSIAHSASTASHTTFVTIAIRPSFG